jgi:hypothetical protein
MALSRGVFQRAACPECQALPVFFSSGFYPSIRHPRSAILDPPSSIRHPRSAILDPPSSIRHPRSSILDPRSSILDPRSSILAPGPSGFPIRGHPLHPRLFVLFLAFVSGSSRDPRRRWQRRPTTLSRSFPPPAQVGGYGARIMDGAAGEHGDNRPKEDSRSEAEVRQRRMAQPAKRRGYSAGRPARAITLSSMFDSPPPALRIPSVAIRFIRGCLFCSWLSSSVRRVIPGGVGNAALPRCRARSLHRLTPAATGSRSWMVRLGNTATERRGYSAEWQYARLLVQSVASIPCS